MTNSINKKEEFVISLGIKSLICILIVATLLISYLWGFGDGFRLIHSKDVSVNCDIMQRYDSGITFYGKDGIQAKMKSDLIMQICGYDTKGLVVK